MSLSKLLRFLLFFYIFNLYFNHFEQFMQTSVLKSRNIMLCFVCCLVTGLPLFSVWCCVRWLSFLLLRCVDKMCLNVAPVLWLILLLHEYFSRVGGRPASQLNLCMKYNKSEKDCLPDLFVAPRIHQLHFLSGDLYLFYPCMWGVMECDGGISLNSFLWLRGSVKWCGCSLFWGSGIWHLWNWHWSSFI